MKFAKKTHKFTKNKKTNGQNNENLVCPLAFPLVANKPFTFS